MSFLLALLSGAASATDLSDWLLVIVSDRSAEAGLCLVDPVDGSARPLQAVPPEAWGPRWLATTGQLWAAVDTEGVGSLVAVTTDGDLAPVGPNPAGDEVPDLSSDGRVAVWSEERDGRRVLMWTDRFPWSPRPMETDVEHASQPRLSPDGERVVFTCRGDGGDHVCVVPLGGGSTRQITTGTARHGHPQWFPDGRRVLLWSDRDGSPDLFVVDVDAPGDGVNVTRHEATEIVGSPSPDGEWIAFGSTRDGNWEVYVARADGGDVRRITAHEGFDGDPVWVPRSAFDRR